MQERQTIIPLLDTVKQNLPILITIFTLVASILIYAFRVDNIETTLAAYTADATKSERNQAEILKELAVLEAKQDRNSEDIQQILTELKGKK